jgi:hypothetical protein
MRWSRSEQAYALLVFIVSFVSPASSSLNRSTLTLM